MSLDNTIVLELPASELSAGNVPRAAAQLLYRLVRSGCKVVAVVSAAPAVQAKDRVRADAMGPCADMHTQAMVLGESSVRLAEEVVASLVEAGVGAALWNPTKLGPVTRGNALDAEPRHLSARGVQVGLERASVLVLPGGVGVDEERRPTSLGEQAGVLSALFVADTLALELLLYRAQATSRLDATRAAEALLTERGWLPDRKATLFAAVHGVRARVYSGRAGVRQVREGVVHIGSRLGVGRARWRGSEELKAS